MNHQAFLLIVRPIQERLFRFAYRFVDNQEEAKDIVQEVLLKLWQNRSKLEGISNKEAWCIKITKNIVLDKIKYNKYRRTESIDHVNERFNHSYLEPEQNCLLQIIKNTINQLPLTQKLIVQLRDIEGFSYEEIAEIMNVGINNVKVILFRGRKAIRERIIEMNAYGLQ